eukprot:scaffold5664_cov115-Isochrysis_galbana.AAC.20
MSREAVELDASIDAPSRASPNSSTTSGLPRATAARAASSTYEADRWMALPRVRGGLAADRAAPPLGTAWPPLPPAKPFAKPPAQPPAQPPAPPSKPPLASGRVAGSAAAVGSYHSQFCGQTWMAT